MRLTSIIAIYILFWSLSFFLVLPFRPQKRGMPDRPVRGEMHGAQGGFSFARAAVWTTIVSIVLFGFYYANYVAGWLPVESFDLVPRRLIEGR